jgi:putative nucleotidyltransferase with HDIG domain
MFSYRLAGQIAQLTDWPERDDLLTAALLHDIGRLQIDGHAGPAPASDEVVTPEQRLRSEQLRLGTDHAEVGAALAERWQFPDTLVAAIRDHHSARCGTAAVVRLADTLCHYAESRLVAVDELVALAEALGIERQALGSLMYDLPLPLDFDRRAIEPCPLSRRELEVISALAQGKIYKQIGLELGLSASTVRSHLHRIYHRLGAADRAQAVLIARDRGWI